jgi:uncharacterized phage protein (TIGR01671 family)
MRDIKFRAFDTKGDGMFYNIQNGISFDDGSKYTFDRFLNPDANDSHEWVVMQFTGLKDKNGKEIYEGDILNGRNQVLKIVYWCPKRAAFCESEQFQPTPAKHSFAKLYDKFRTVFCKDGQLINHEVIGNIYEHPHLLKQPSIL